MSKLQMPNDVTGVRFNVCSCAQQLFDATAGGGQGANVSPRYENFSISVFITAASKCLSYDIRSIDRDSGRC